MVIRDPGLRHLTLTQNVHHVRRERPRPAHVTPCFASGTKRCSLLLRVHPAKPGAFPSSLTSAKKLTPKLGLRGLICACSCKRVLPLTGSYQPAHTRVARPDFGRTRPTHLATIRHHLGTAVGCIVALYLHGTSKNHANRKAGSGNCEALFASKQSPPPSDQAQSFAQNTANVSKTCPAPCTLNTEGLPVKRHSKKKQCPMHVSSPTCSSHPRTRACCAQDFGRARPTHLATIRHHLGTAVGCIVALHLHGTSKKHVRASCAVRPFRAGFAAMQRPQAAAKPKASHRTRATCPQNCPARCVHRCMAVGAATDARTGARARNFTPQ